MTRLVWTLPDGQQTARWAEDEGGGGGSQALSLLGPFTVNFDDAGLATTGVVLHTFDAPSLVVSAAVFKPTPWTSGDPIPFEVTAGTDLSTVNNSVLWSTSDMIGGEAQAAFTRWFGGAAGNWVLAGVGDVLGADTFGSAVVTAGVATVYAVVAGT